MRTLLLAVLALASASEAQAKIGLAARFGDVILEGAQPGRTYSLREAARVPLGVENRGDAETEVVVEFDRPRESKLSQDYEAIPDLSWLKSIPDKITVAPKGVGFFDLMLTVPDDPTLVGRHFQVIVRLKSGGGLFGVAIENKVRISIGPGPASIAAEKKKKAMQKLDFDVTPQALYLTGVPVGKAWDSRKESRKSVRVANYDAAELKVVLSVEKWDTRFPLPQGYEEIPDLAWLKLKPSTVTVQGDEIGQASVVVTVPDAPENRGRRWAAMLRTGLATGFWLDAPVKLFVETSP